MTSVLEADGDPEAADGDGAFVGDQLAIKSRLRKTKTLRRTEVVTTNRSASSCRRVATGAVVAVFLWAIIAGISTTSAAFTEEKRAHARVSGRVDVSQSADGLSQYSDPRAPQQIRIAPEARPIRALPEGGSGEPRTETASFAVEIYLSPDSAESDVYVSVYDQELSDASAISDALVFGVYDSSVSLLRDGTPLPAPELLNLNNGRGAALPISLKPGTSTSIRLKIWLRADAPRSAFNQPANIGIRVLAETRVGESFVLEESLE
ncbi:hypothetical protein [Plantibacter sp. M259]|uniref:hypothetical protein n=1 Tax=Plantibacter sp. M259 TaxID=2583822 RepID=UPI00111021BF|nr:hypothetical protein [Plantibacter sp. M259]